MKEHLLGTVAFISTFVIYYLGGGDFERGHAFGFTTFVAMFLYVATASLVKTVKDINKIENEMRR